MKKLIFASIFLLFIAILTGMFENLDRSMEERSIRKEALMNQRAAAQKLNRAKRERIQNYEKVLNFTLCPGQAKRIETKGDMFDMSYYGEAIVVYHKGASEQWLKTKGSEHFYVYPSKVADLEAITIIRPRDSIGPLGFKIVLGYNEHNKQKEY